MNSSVKMHHEAMRKRRVPVGAFSIERDRYLIKRLGPGWTRVDAAGRRGALRTQSGKMTGTAGADAAVIKISRVRMFRSRLQFIKKGWRNKSGSKSKYFHQCGLLAFLSLSHTLLVSRTIFNNDAVKEHDPPLSLSLFMREYIHTLARCSSESETFCLPEGCKSFTINMASYLNVVLLLFIRIFF
jgi:hypothetical protein